MSYLIDTHSETIKTSKKKSANNIVHNFILASVIPTCLFVSGYFVAQNVALIVVPILITILFTFALNGE